MNEHYRIPKGHIDQFKSEIINTLIKNKKKTKRENVNNIRYLGLNRYLS